MLSVLLTIICAGVVAYVCFVLCWGKAEGHKRTDISDFITDSPGLCRNGGARLFGAAMIFSMQISKFFQLRSVIKGSISVRSPFGKFCPSIATILKICSCASLVPRLAESLGMRL